MFKRISILMGLCMILTSVQIQSTPEDNSTAVGLALFATTIKGVQTIQRWNQLQTQSTIPSETLATNPKKNRVGLVSGRQFPLETNCNKTIIRRQLFTKKEKSEALKLTSENLINNQLAYKQKTIAHSNNSTNLPTTNSNGYNTQAQKWKFEQPFSGQTRQQPFISNPAIPNTMTIGSQNNNKKVTIVEKNQLIPKQPLHPNFSENIKTKKLTPSSSAATSHASSSSIKSQNQVAYNIRPQAIIATNSHKQPAQNILENGQTNFTTIDQASRNFGHTSNNASNIRNTSKYPDFSDNIFLDLKNNQNLLHHTATPNKKIYFLDKILQKEKIELEPKKEDPSMDLLFYQNRIIQQDTIKPNRNDPYWKNRKTNKIIIFPYIHGTVNAELHGSGKELSTGNYFQTMLSAKKVAIAENATVKVLFFAWTGGLSELERRNAGQDLAHNIKKMINTLQMNADSKNADISVLMAGHSHGGNVMDHAAKALEPTIKIKQAIMFGTPILDNKSDEPNTENLLNIYGDNDFTGCAGSALSTCSLASILTGGVTTSLRKNNATNVLLKIDGKNIGHRETAEKGLNNLPEIMQCLTSDFPDCRDVILNVPNSGKIFGCCNEKYCNFDHTTAMQEKNKKNAAKYTHMYKESIYEENCLHTKFQTEYGPYMHPVAATAVGAVVSLFSLATSNSLPVKKQARKLKRTENADKLILPSKAITSQTTSSSSSEGTSKETITPPTCANTTS